MSSACSTPPCDICTGLKSPTVKIPERELSAEEQSSIRSVLKSFVLSQDFVESLELPESNSSQDFANASLCPQCQYYLKLVVNWRADVDQLLNLIEDVVLRLRTSYKDKLTLTQGPTPSIDQDDNVIDSTAEQSQASTHWNHDPNLCPLGLSRSACWAEINKLNFEYVPPKETPKTYKCSQCSEVFDTIYLRTKHRRTVHLKLAQNVNVTYPCPHCDELFYRQPQLRVHLWECHRPLLSPNFPPPILHPCPRNCGKQFVVKSQIKQHIARQHRDAEHPCDKCPKKFMSKLALKTHVSDVHLGRRRKNCEICKKMFCSFSALKTHNLRFHSDEKMIFSCKYCKEKLESYASQRKHYLEQHFDQLPHLKCKECGKEFRLGQDLRFHLRCHNPKECQKCHRKFTANNYKRHITRKTDCVTDNRGRKQSKVQDDYEEEEEFSEDDD